MKMIVVALALVAAALAAPPPGESKVVRSEFNQNPDGSYVSGYETDDGARRDETGELKKVPDEEGKPRDVVVVRGSYSYIDPEGKLETVAYHADETGFHPEGDSIPKAPARK